MDDRTRIIALLDSLPGEGGARLATGERVELDSLQLLEVITLIEKEFGIDFGGQDVDPEDFRSLDSLLALLGRRSS